MHFLQAAPHSHSLLILVCSDVNQGTLSFYNMTGGDAASHEIKFGQHRNANSLLVLSFIVLSIACGASLCNWHTTYVPMPGDAAVHSFLVPVMKSHVYPASGSAA